MNVKNWNYISYYIGSPTANILSLLQFYVKKTWMRRHQLWIKLEVQKPFTMTRIVIVSHALNKKSDNKIGPPCGLVKDTIFFREASSLWCIWRSHYVTVPRLPFENIIVPNLKFFIVWWKCSARLRHEILTVLSVPHRASVDWMYIGNRRIMVLYFVTETFYFLRQVVDCRTLTVQCFSQVSYVCEVCEESQSPAFWGDQSAGLIAKPDVGVENLIF